MPVIMENNMMTISIAGNRASIGISIIRRYFDMVPVGPEGDEGVLQRLLRAGGGAEAEAADGRDSRRRRGVFEDVGAMAPRRMPAANGFKIIYDQSYPPSTTDYAPVVRAVQAANPDVVFVAAYPPDTVGIVRAAQEVGLKPKMFGGTMIGLLITPIKMQLGPLLDGIVIMESFVPAPTFNFPGVADVLKRYQEKAAAEKIDPFGFGFVPFGYAAGQVLAQAVEETKSLDHAKLADYLHSHTLNTVLGDIEYTETGEWAKQRNVFTQFQNVAANNLDQFRDGKVQPILWPPEYKTGDMIYPYADAKK